MRNLPIIMFVVLLLTPGVQAQTIPPSSAPIECNAIPAPSRQDLEPWLAGSAFSPALKFYLRQMFPAAASQFATAWAKVAGELEKAFATAECDYDAVNATLDRRVFKAPPDAIPMDEEFGLPLMVAMAAADAACRTGDTASAMRYLRPAADSVKPAALAALVVLESISAPAAAVARVTDSAATNSPEIALAACLASIRSGHRNDRWCDGSSKVGDGRQQMAIIDLIRNAGEATAR